MFSAEHVRYYFSLTSLSLSGAVGGAFLLSPYGTNISILGGLISGVLIWASYSRKAQAEKELAKQIKIVSNKLELMEQVEATKKTTDTWAPRHQSRIAFITLEFELEDLKRSQSKMLRERRSHVNSSLWGLALAGSTGGVLILSSLGVKWAIAAGIAATILSLLSFLKFGSSGKRYDYESLFHFPTPYAKSQRRKDIKAVRKWIYETLALLFSTSSKKAPDLLKHSSIKKTTKDDGVDL